MGLRSEYLTLIITELQIINTILKNITDFPSIFSQIHQKSSSYFWSKLHQFFTKLSNSFCFVLHGPRSSSVSSSHCLTLQESRLSIPCTSMEFWEFSRLEHVGAELAFPFNFIINKHHLFVLLSLWNLQIFICHFFKVHFRNSQLLQLLCVSCSVFIIDQHASDGLWIG